MTVTSKWLDQGGARGERPPPVRIVAALLHNLVRGDATAAAELLEREQDRLRELVALLLASRLAGYCHALLADTPLPARLPPAIADTLAEQYQQQADSSHRNLRLIADIQCRLQGASIPFLTLKGLYQAQRFLGDIRRRFIWDLDILVHTRDLDAAIAQLEQAGLARSAAAPVDVRRDFFGIHAVELKGEAGKVDIHVALRKLPGMRFDYDTIWRDSHTFEVGGITLPTISDADTLLIAALGVAADIQRGAHNLRKIWDIHIMLAQLDPVMDWPAFLARRRDEGSLTMVLNVFAFVEHLLAVDDDCPRLMQALRTHAPLLLITGGRQALAVFARPRGHFANRLLFSRLLPVSAARYWTQWLLLLPLRQLHYRRAGRRDRL